jgi:hypothetical protein
MTDLHPLAAPVFTRMLGNLSTWLDKAEAHAAAKKFAPEVLMQSRLAPDMLPLHGQIALATAFAKNAMCRLAGEEAPDFPDGDDTFPKARARIARALGVVEGIGPERFAGAEARMLKVRVGPEMTLDMNGVDYLQMFVLPNFWFHTTHAYAILRHNGVDLGKRDFLTGASQ